MEKQLLEEMIELQRQVDHDRRQYELDAWLRLHLGIGQLKALFFISNRGSTTAGKLAATLGITPANVTGIIDRLLEKNLIMRTRDLTNRRVFLLRTTPDGDELVDELRQKRKERITELFNRLTTEDAKIVKQFLQIMVKAIESGEH
ncbi:MAG: MarR family transcriptional regulator [Dehalococcoidales bacterium]